MHLVYHRSHNKRRWAYNVSIVCCRWQNWGQATDECSDYNARATIFFISQKWFLSCRCTTVLDSLLLINFFLFITGRSQVLFSIVFLTRYLDLFTSFISVYNTAMKIFFLVSSLGTVYLMYVKFKATYDQNHDTFR